MNNKLLGAFAIVCAPFLYINFLTSNPNDQSWDTGLYGFIYMAGWMASVYALRQGGFLGTTKFSRIAFIVQMTLLSLAQVWNIWVMIGPSDHILFHITDACWPLSNIWMLVMGIHVLVTKQLTGWKRYVPLFVGLWFPLTVIPAMTAGIFWLAGPYSLVAFVLLGLVVFTSPPKESLAYVRA